MLKFVLTSRRVIVGQLLYQLPLSYVVLSEGSVYVLNRSSVISKSKVGAEEANIKPLSRC